MFHDNASMYLNIKLCMISITTYSDTDSVRIGFISKIEISWEVPNNICEPAGYACYT